MNISKNYSKEVDEYIANNKNNSNDIYMGVSVIEDDEYKCIENLLYGLFENLDNRNYIPKPLKIITGRSTCYNKAEKKQINLVEMFIHFDSK